MAGKIGSGGRETDSSTDATVLVVEDNRDASFMICEALKYHIGCRILTASNGKECLKLVRKTPPDAVLLDVHMPDMDGFDVCRRLKEDDSTNRIPVLFLTATAHDIRSKIMGLEMGAYDYLTQPVDNIELITRVKVMLRFKRLLDGIGEPPRPRLSDKAAHDLRAPLNTIIGMSELLQTPAFGPLSRKQREFAEIISRSGQRLLELIDGIVDG